MRFREDDYNRDVDAYFEKLKDLVTNEQLVELFRTWPDKNSYYEMDDDKTEDKKDEKDNDM